MLTSRMCSPEVSGMRTEAYPLAVSLPRKSMPYTLIASRGHPYTLVDLNVASIGKLKTRSCVVNMADLVAV